MRRKWEINLEDPMKYQCIVGDVPNQYYVRTSVLGVNYIAHFIEDFEDTYKRKARILEFGDGISTLWFAKNFPENEIFSVGGDPWWFNWVEELISKEAPKNKLTHAFYKATNFYVTERDEDDSYAHAADDWGSFDVILNDGAQREFVGDYLLSNANQFISPGGIYLRHDYEMAILGNWVGFRQEPLPEWCRDEKDLGYEGFCHLRPEYSMVTTTGNGLAGYVMEYGGVWRKVDHQFKRKMDVEKLREENNGSS